jgi:hypothetical protein
MRYVLAFLALALVSTHAAAFDSDPSCQRVGPLAQCVYVVSPAGAGRTQTPVKIDQPTNSVLHAQPGGAIVTFSGSSHLSYDAVTVSSDVPITLTTGKSFLKVKYPVMVKTAYTVDAKITVDQRDYYLLSLSTGSSIAATYFLIDAQTGEVYNRFANLAPGYVSGMVSLSMNGMASTDPVGAKFNIGTKQSGHDSAPITHALVFDHMYGASLQLGDQTIADTGAATTTPLNEVVHVGSSFDWRGITIQVVSLSSQDIGYQIVAVSPQQPGQ